MVLLYIKFYIGINISLNTDNNRFAFILLSFILSIIILVFSRSWVTLIIGWDGLGLSSFLLVIYYRNSKRLSGGLLTFLTNRFGDALFILTFLNINYIGWFFLEFIETKTSMFFLFLIILGATTKRAQYPFCSWLPAAIAAPTPVSSLVHSSTLVTAGVYVLIRFNFLVQGLIPLLCVISLATMTIRGFTANLELDFKKVIAISTLSQLGFIIFTLSLGYWSLAFFHVLFHAFFKSSLFLSTGSLIHEIYRIQDSRLYGGSQSSFLAKLYFISCCFSLMGFPFTLGFYSKDRILRRLSNNHPNLTVWVFTLACGLTVAYCLRIIYISLNKTINSPTILEKGENYYFIFPILLLVIFKTLIGGFFFIEFFFIEVFTFLESMLGVFVFILGFLLTFIRIKKKINLYFFLLYILP